MNIYLLPVATIDWLNENYQTDEERIMALRKLQIAKGVIRATQSLTEAMDDGPDRVREFWDLRDAGDAFTDGDLTPLGITSGELGICVDLLTKFAEFLNAEPQVWRTAINKVRHVNTNTSQ